jgi:myo-inositol-1(or 4)-monophosphatase
MSNISSPEIKSINIEQLLQWLEEAGSVALAERSRGIVAFKGDATPTTPADRMVESLLRSRISEHFPDHQVLAEETGLRGRKGDWLWIIDPIDGTRAYASGLPSWAISVGVLHRGGPFWGAVFFPALSRMFWGSSSGAFSNGRVMRELSGADIDQKLAFVAVPSNAHRLYDLDFPRVRSLGSTVAHLATVACGSAIGALTRAIKIWDIAGMLPILQQTEISLTYLSGQPLVISELLDGRSAPEPLLAAHPCFMEQVRAGVKTKGGSTDP